MQYTLKKHLGQHFLHDEDMCQRIVDTTTQTDVSILEIGPGAGAITKYFIQNNHISYKCVELDQEKVDYLLLKYPSLKTKIIHEDFLKITQPFDGEFEVVGNFPYNISSQILFKILDWKNQVYQVVGMFQKEVAERVTSKHGKKSYGILSVLIQCYYDVEYLFDVPPNCFTPPPKVMSAVIRLKRKEIPLLNDNEQKFKQFVKNAFNQRRKTLRNGLKSFYKPEQLTDEIFNKRAEQLNVTELISLFQKLHSF
ncbi:MAG TPA: 16S rRNA (adenine(1518)-N(6)/adenine(1519)-N(6))-dimethyltransferase RsmA [Chitinophagaceae bacterium]|nr:MAG: dimethyladenosine transferase [Bacteroidetes bacterium OLB11]HMN32300.1 16S rRNA (adenine(1518)-N(6)/adenine(1519)-N(6))-dimethyltransferase RsmA [Chitinophagaceae bacterium]